MGSKTPEDRGELLTLLDAEAIEKELAHAGEVKRGRIRQDIEACRRNAHERAALVLPASRTLGQAITLKALHNPPRPRS